MPSSAVRTFTDPDNYAAAIRATKAEVTVTRRGRFTAEITRIDLHRLWMQRFSDNLPRVGHSAGMSGRAIISFRTQPGPSLLWGSVEMHPNNIVRHGEGGGVISIALRGGRAAGGKRPRNHRPSRGGARSRAGADRGLGRLSRRGVGWRGQVSPAPPFADHAPVSQSSGRKP